MWRDKYELKMEMHTTTRSPVVTLTLHVTVIGFYDIQRIS